MHHRTRRPFFLTIVLVVVVLLASAWTPRRDSLPAASGPVSAVFRPVVKVSGPVLVTVAAVMQKRLAALDDRASTATAADGVIDVRLVDVTDSQTVLEVLATPARLYFRPVLCDAPAYVAPTKGTKDAPSAATRVPTCAAPYRYSSTDFSGSASSSYNFPPEDHNYADYPSSTVDNPAENIILPSSGNGPAPRFVLGPASVVYDGKTEPVTGTIIKSAYAQLDTSSNQWTVIFDLTNAGSNVFNADATLHYGRLIADDLDGTVISAPIIEAREFPGSGQVSGNFSKESADAFAAELNSGALPVDVERVPSSK